MHKNHQPDGLAITYQSVALIVGVTGITGSGLAETLSLADTPGGPWKVYSVARRPCPEWLTTLHVDYIQCDISKSEEIHSKLSPLKDITHVFYVTFAGSEDVAVNTLMFQNILDFIIPNPPNLKHVALQTGIKYYWGNLAEKESTNQPHDCPFYENLPRLKQENFYYNIEDLVYEVGMMSMVSTLCVCAVICMHENKPLVYTGTEDSWTCMMDCVDSELLADHLIWAGTDRKAKNEAFNVNNGDVFKWKHMWGVLGEQFGVESVGYEGREPILLEDLMKGKDEVWDEIVKKNDLVPTKLRDIAAFWLVDVVFRNKEMLSSMNKNKELGFLGFRDSTKSFVNCVKKMRDYTLIP
ncbi:hypothetical protein ACS0TY_025863 [Phlomoides rotata]